MDGAYSTAAETHLDGGRDVDIAIVSWEPRALDPAALRTKAPGTSSCTMRIPAGMKLARLSS